MSRASEVARFWSHVDRTGGRDACWPWVGAHNSGGYGVFTTRRRVAVPAHRFAYVLANGATLSPGMRIGHQDGCARDCCNPAHLVERVGNPLADANTAKQTCAAGHVYDAVRVRDGRTSRVCRACAAARFTRWAAAHR